MRNDSLSNLVLDIWDVIRKNVAASKQEGLADALLGIFEDNGYELDSIFDELYGEDEVLDWALDHRYTGDEDSDEDPEEIDFDDE